MTLRYKGGKVARMASLMTHPACRLSGIGVIYNRDFATSAFAAYKPATDFLYARIERQIVECRKAEWFLRNRAAASRVREAECHANSQRFRERQASPGHAFHIQNVA